LSPELAGQVQQLLADIGWWGIAELQFVVPPDGTPHLIDLNGRFYGSLALTSAAGVDLPTAWLEAARGNEVRLGQPRIGVRYQWLLGDLKRIRRSTDRRPSAWWQALSYAPGAAHSVWALRDPVPALRQGLDLVTRRGIGMLGR
jgi:predicted ATP-grasp superfamily ATP-dependent carboligase